MQNSGLAAFEEQKQSSIRNLQGRSLKPQDTVEEIKISARKPRKVPNYMRPNAAWLGRNDQEA